MEEQAESLTPMMAGFRGAVQRMNLARDAMHACRGKVQTMEKARKAAQADADEARAQWRGLLREGNGTLCKEGQRLRAAERSAYTLQEEYEQIINEMQPVLLARNLELAQVAKECIAFNAAAAKEAAEVAMAEIVAAHGPAIRRAMELRKRALYAGERGKPVNQREWGGLSDKSEKDAGSHFMWLLEKELLKLDPAHHESDEITLDLSDVDMELAMSTAKMAQARAHIERAS